ncbi:14-3-3 domain-containing protein, partial [Delphinella strobiligena]
TMAVSAVDLRMLGALAEDTVTNNVLLSSCLFQILGLSVALSQQLARARSQRKLDYTRDTKSIKLYHHILWLAREGLSITEVFILPYCQDGEQGPECRVMAAKLRASFYHIFCLFHNHPPVFQIKPSEPSTSTTSTSRQGLGFSNDNLAPLPQNVAGHRDSMVSESSYITNPFAATSPPPDYPIPPLPSTPSRRDAPSRPPGFSPQQHSPPSSALFLLPPLNFVPAASNYFQIASSLARTLLRGAHPLRLSVTHEYTAFLCDCVKDYEGARRAAGDAVRAAYDDHTNLSDREWEDVLKMVRALTGIAKRAGGSSS